jgi:hypothetical protein
MPRKIVPSYWQCVHAPANDPEPEPELLTDEELAQVNTLYTPLETVIEHFIETQTEWPYEAILEALARLTNYYEGLNGHMNQWIDEQIAIEDADA